MDGVPPKREQTKVLSIGSAAPSEIGVHCGPTFIAGVFVGGFV